MEERKNKQKKAFFLVWNIQNRPLIKMVNTKKFAALMPSLREKKRYIAFEIISEKPVYDFSSVYSAIWDSCLSYLGTLGVSKAGIWILPDKYSSETQRGLIRVSRKEVDNVKAAFITIRQIGSQDVIVRSLGVSGILDKAQQKYLNTSSL